MYKNDAVFYPQDEMYTTLLPVTTGCIYNKCLFCTMYKDNQYSEVAFSDIKMELLNGYKYTEKIFLTGADPITIGFEKMKKLLKLIHEYLPYCACVASYASIKSISKYTIEELSTLHNLGLRLLYIGFETGRDDILKLMNKGHTSEKAIIQAKKLNQAGISFNTIIMYGIAGNSQSIDNAIATSKMINQFVTNEVITMNLTIMEGSKLKHMSDKLEFIPATRQEKLIEIKTLLENLEPKQPMIFNTTHPTNIVKIKGILVQDKKNLINKIITQI